MQILSYLKLYKLHKYIYTDHLRFHYIKKTVNHLTNAFLSVLGEYL